jgi:hypothetical protein
MLLGLERIIFLNMRDLKLLILLDFVLGDMLLLMLIFLDYGMVRERQRLLPL